MDSRVEPAALAGPGQMGEDLGHVLRARLAGVVANSARSTEHVLLLDLGATDDQALALVRDNDRVAPRAGAFAEVLGYRCHGHEAERWNEALSSLGCGLVYSCTSRCLV